ncbi:alkaline shock response membrane anchor protein AmaP [Streptomyces sp. BA2]|uniref:alkaline shock response membrane anchor protein AmaP n=1 Tax=Streptomyces sp. BA2 TaxID=436595 RepID=UPI001326204F|nr:alkaline shock response membrane anchor protein AmaP [Streptomyces sp. BA2]MWA09229.1 alkaline shock response membrane anchor protein AmaP [Streptomyces sp. BA2]
MSRLRSGTNRSTLLCAAAVLLFAGAVLASAAAPVRDRLPSALPRVGADRVWLDQEVLGRWRDHDWWPPVVIAALAVGTVLFLCWTAAQIRTGRLRELPLGQAGVTLSAGALASAMAERARAVDGVARAHVRLLGRPRRLRARITLVLETDGSPEAVLRELARGTIAEARAAAAPRTLEADVRLTTRRHRARRVH